MGRLTVNLERETLEAYRQNAKTPTKTNNPLNQDWKEVEFTGTI